MSFWTKRAKTVDFDQELATAVRVVTEHRFASLPDRQQADGIRRLSRALAIYADELEDGLA